MCLLFSFHLALLIHTYQERVGLYAVIGCIVQDLWAIDVRCSPYLSLRCMIRFSNIQIKSLLKQLLGVLDFVHAHKYVHRDIKCSNLLIDNRLHLKVRGTSIRML